MNNEKKYCGVEKDLESGLSTTGNIIRDAWVFGLLDPEETCKDWTLGQLQVIYDRVYGEWEKYGHLASNLPEELKSRHEAIYAEAIEKAKSYGWNPELGEDD